MVYTWIGSVSWLAGGSQIDLGARTAGIDFNRFAPTIPVLGDNGPHEVDIVGNPNATFSVEGVYFMNTQTNSVGSPAISQAIAGSMSQIGSIVWFHDDEFQGQHRMGSWLGGSMAVIPQGFRANRNIQSEETGSQIVHYQITLTETKEF